MSENLSPANDEAPEERPLLLAAMQKDLTDLEERLRGVTSKHDIDIKVELVDNILPLMSQLADSINQIDQRLFVNEDIVEHVEDAVDKLIDGASEVLHPESAELIGGTLEVGKILCGELTKILQLRPNQKLSDAAKERIRKQIAVYQTGHMNVLNLLQEITVEEDEDPDAEDFSGTPEVAIPMPPDDADGEGDEAGDGE